MSYSRKPFENTKWIAAFEFVKGVVVLVVGLGLLTFMNQDLQAAGENLVARLKLNPAHRYPEIFIQTLGKMNDTSLWLLALGAVFYSTVRFVEAYGLWRQCLWAEWFAIISCSLYIPIELYEMWRGPGVFKFLIMAVNALIVVYLLECVRAKKSAEAASRMRPYSLRDSTRGGEFSERD